MGVKPSKSIDDRLLRSYHTHDISQKRRNPLRVVLRSRTNKKVLTSAADISIEPSTSQLPNESTDNEIMITTSDSTINNTNNQTNNAENHMCNNNNNAVDAYSIKRSSPDNSTSCKSKKSRKEKSCSFASNTIDSKHVSRISYSNTISDIGMYSNKSAISSDCWTNFSNDPFSQIEVNTSAFTEITDQSTISRKSLYPVLELSLPPPPQQQHLFQSENALLLDKLNSHPDSVHLILNEAYHLAQEQNDVNDWLEFYTALDKYIAQPTTPALSRNCALAYLATCFILGLGTTKNVDHGVHLLTTHPSCETTFALGKFYLTTLQNKAFECIKTASEYTILNDSMRATVSEAQCTLARVLFQGQGITQNSQLALNYLMKSAENDNMYAQFLIGVHFERGFEIEKDLEKAKFYYRKSANSGFPDAQAALGSRLIAESNYSEGVEWLEKSVQKGNSRAHVQLGILYDKGEGVPQNNDMALLHYKVAVENNNPAAQYILGLVYYFGRLGRQKNYKDAIRLIRQSAVAGLPYAQRVLGQLYQQGNIANNHRNRTNDVEAIRWFRRASAGGDIAALGILGKCFELGRGVEIDLKKALAFYAKAAEAKNSPYIYYAHIDQARLLQKMARHTEAFAVYNKVLTLEPMVADKRSIQTAQCSIARYHLCRDIEGVQYNPTLAYTILLNLTETSNDPLAHYWLGAIYDEGIPGVVDIQRQKAFHHFMVAAESGDNDATFLVAYMLSNYAIPEKGPPDAFPWYQKAALKGHPMSMYSLGLCYYKGIGHDSNLERALEWFEKSARYGVQEAWPYIARVNLKQMVLHTNTDDSKQFLKRAIEALKQGAENDVYSQRELGKIYLTGQGVDIDHALAVDLLQKAAMKNDAEALAFLGDCYQKGVGVERNTETAVEHYLRSADLGYPYAYSAAAEYYYEMGDLIHAYEYYNLASKDTRIANTDVGKTAKMMVARLALGDLPNIQNNPSIFQILLNSSDITIITAHMAFEQLFTLAVEDQFVQAFQPLGSCYLYGHGTEINPSQALVWLQKAAEEHNDPIAYFHLSYLYKTSENKTLAFDYLNKSAVMGCTEAQFQLGMVYLHGDNDFITDKNECTAAIWFKRAASNSHSQSAWTLSEMASRIHQDELQFQYQESAASFGHVLAMRIVGQHYLNQLDDVPNQNECLEKALKYLHTAGDANDVESLVLLGKTYIHGTKTRVRFCNNTDEEDSLFQSEEDEKALGIECFTRASELGDLEATVYAAEAWYEQQQYAAALELFEKAANQGHALARFFRARYYIEGYAGCPCNPEKGFQELLMCANDLNCIHAYNTLGQCYENGIGTTRNDQLAYEWYLRAAEITNDAEAYYRIGLMYAKGCLISGHHKDIEARHYFDLAVNTTPESHGMSCYQLGLYSLNGISAEDSTFILAPDVCLALEYFRTASDLDIPEAMLQLAHLFLIKDDDIYSLEEQEEGLALLQRAANLGLSEAQFELGLLYHHGKEVALFEHDDTTMLLLPQNFEKAYDLFCRAAVQRHPAATYYLGVYHQHGIFVTPDPRIALEQFELAVELFEGSESRHRWMAEYHLARILHYDMESRAHAYELFQAAHMHAPTQYKVVLKIMITRYHLHGWGQVEVRLEQAVNALIQFAQEDKCFGHFAYLELAQCFENGLGVDQNMHQALHWYGEVIHSDKSHQLFVLDDEESEGVAMFKLGEFYRQGIVVAKNLQKANDLYRLAVEKGYSAAQDYIIHTPN